MGASNLARMSHLCSHGLNPRTCLPCLRVGPKPSVAAKARPYPLSPAEAMNASVMASVKAKAFPARSAEIAVLGGAQEPGEASSSEATTEPAPPVAYVPPSIPRPVSAEPRPGVVPSPAKAGPVIEPYRSHASPRYDAKGLWQPAHRPQLIDRLPRHPDPTGAGAPKR